MHKKNNFALSILELLTFVNYLYTLNIVWNITQKFNSKISTRNSVGNYISLSRSAVHKQRHTVLPIFLVIALCFFYTLNFVRDITLKLLEVSTRIIIGWLISFSRSAVHMNHHSALPTFGVISLCSFYTLNLVQNIILKLQAISTILFVGRWI